MILRRKLQLVLGLVAVFACSLLPILDMPPFETGAYLQAVTGREAVVAIVTAEPSRIGLVVKHGEEIVFEAAPGAESKRHELRATDLVPARRYEFELRDAAGAIVDQGRFVTRSVDDARPVHFAIIGDSGGLPAWAKVQNSPLIRLTGGHNWLPVDGDPAAVADVLLELDPDFWLHTGDVIYPDGSRDDAAAGFFRPFGAVLRRSPIYPVLGNHDVMTENGAPFLENFVLPDADGAGERNFTFRDGPLRVVGIDLMDDAGPSAPAYAYLRRVAGASSEPWLIVVNHYPVRSVYRDSTNVELERNFIPLCRELGVDMVVAGHDHNYQRFGEPGDLLEIVTGGGGKSLYEIKRRPEGLAVAEVAYHACEVRIDGAVLRFIARAVDGRVLDDFTVDKAARAMAGDQPGPPQRLERLRALIR